MNTACSSSSENSNTGMLQDAGDVQTVGAEDTEPAVNQSADTSERSGANEPTQAEQPGDNDDEHIATQDGLADAVLAILRTDSDLPDSITTAQLGCLADSVAAAFTDQRILELGFTNSALVDSYDISGSFLLGDRFEIDPSEADKIVGSAASCTDWRRVFVDTMEALGADPEAASCYGVEVSDDGIEALVSGVFISAEGLVDAQSEAASQEMFRVVRACTDLRAVLFESLVEGSGVSTASAQCVVDNMADELVDAYFRLLDPNNSQELADSSSQSFIAELQALERRCFTVEELAELNRNTDPSSDQRFEENVGSQSCPAVDGPRLQVLDFDGSQPMCLDIAKRYTAVFDTTAGEMRVELDMVNTPKTANNFAVLARYGYYDDTLLFRTDPSIGIIQGGSPHTNSPADPGPGYTIADEGAGFTYEPGQIVMARTAAPNSAGAQFFFAVNENTALLNSQGTYVVFGKLDAESLKVAEAILASHQDQPNNPLGGAPNPAVTINSVMINENS